MTASQGQAITCLQTTAGHSMNGPSFSRSPTVPRRAGKQKAEPVPAAHLLRAPAFRQPPRPPRISLAPMSTQAEPLSSCPQWSTSGGCRTSYKHPYDRKEPGPAPFSRWSFLCACRNFLQPLTFAAPSSQQASSTQPPASQEDSWSLFWRILGIHFPVILHSLG